MKKNVCSIHDIICINYIFVHCIHRTVNENLFFAGFPFDYWHAVKNNIYNVEQKYNDIKDEMLNNTIYRLKKEKFDIAIKVFFRAFLVRFCLKFDRVIWGITQHILSKHTIN